MLVLEISWQKCFIQFISWLLYVKSIQLHQILLECSFIRVFWYVKKHAFHLSCRLFKWIHHGLLLIIAIWDHPENSLMLIEPCRKWQCLLRYQNIQNLIHLMNSFNKAYTPFYQKLPKNHESFCIEVSKKLDVSSTDFHF